MTKRYPVSSAPGPLENYAQSFDELFGARAQRHSFRRYLEGLLLPAERNKTLTALANTEPLKGAQRKEAQSLQWFLSESSWDYREINRRRVELLLEDPANAPNDRGALVIDETGDRKEGEKTAHVGRQYLSSIGKIDNGVVSVSSLWADERVYYPLEVEPYTPGHHFEDEKEATLRTSPEAFLRLVSSPNRARHGGGDSAACPLGRFRRSRRMGETFSHLPRRPYRGVVGAGGRVPTFR